MINTQYYSNGFYYYLCMSYVNISPNSNSVQSRTLTWNNEFGLITLIKLIKSIGKKTVLFFSTDMFIVMHAYN